MISRLTAFAAAFAVISAATLTFAAGAAQQPAAASRAPQAKAVRIVQLDTVVVVGHRTPAVR